MEQHLRIGTLKSIVAEAEVRAIKDALILNYYNVTKAAGSLGVNKFTLYDKLKKYNIRYK